MRRRDDGMYIRYGSVHTQCTSDSKNYIKYARGMHHGQCAHGQRDALRHVLIAGDSDGSIGDSGGYGGAYSHALHTGMLGALGSGLADSASGRQAGIEQFKQADVHVRGRDIDHQSRHDEYTGTVEIAAGGAQAWREATESPDM